MKKLIGRIITALILILIVGLLVWRFWPRSSSAIIPMDESAITDYSATAMVGRFENGQSYTDTYRVDNVDSKPGDPGALLKILASSGYRPDFRNLLPWGIDSVSADRNYGNQTVLLYFYAHNSEEVIIIHFLSPSIIAVNTNNESGMRIYHPANRETLHILAEYLQDNGYTPLP